MGKLLWVKVAYGDKEMYLFQDVHRNIRDSVLERRINKGISAYFSGYDSKSHELYLEGNEHRLYQLLTEGLPELASYGEIFISDKLKKINVVKHGPVQVGVKVNNGLLDLTLKSKDLSSEQLAEILMPGFLYTYKKFRTNIETAMVQHQNKQVAERLRKMVTPFILRRLKKDVLSDLPDKIEENIIMPMVDEQRKVYDARASRLKEQLEGQSSDEFRTSKIKNLAELTRLRQLCCDPALVYENYEAGSAKVDMCMDLVQEAVDGGHKVLLFSQFTSVFEGLQKQLSEREISHFSLTGSTSKEERIRLVDLFNHDDTSVFCISLKAGGTGLNLTAADIVIHFDPWWNVAAQNQATDRAHRIGQNSVVNVYKLIAKDSIEEKILKMQERKQALADEVLSGEGIGGASFSKEELLEILG